MYDLLIVGAGLTAATLVAKLRCKLKICVIDYRSHLGGNCFDEPSSGSFIHRYGPHIFHSPSLRIVKFLEAFTEWVPYSHSVIAEVQDGGSLVQVPFPYCRQTIQKLGRELSEPQILNMFFRDYSQKMWGMPWEELPASIRGRVPSDTYDTPLYYRHHFVAMPRFGYTRMMENMLGGADLLLGAPANEWINISAKTVVYTGRPDLIPLPGERESIAQVKGLMLNYRTLDITFSEEEWPHNATCLHACHLDRSWTRKTSMAHLTGGQSRVITTEYPRQAEGSDLSPFYPIELARNQESYRKLAAAIPEYYPTLHLAGRLGSYRYFDMYQAVGQALSVAHKLWPQICESEGPIDLTQNADLFLDSEPERRCGPCAAVACRTQNG